MMRFAFGLFFGPYLGLVVDCLDYWPSVNNADASNLAELLSILVFLLVFLGVPAIGGYVVVGQMIKEYGVCTMLM
jgi:hypothetical protein